MKPLRSLIPFLAAFSFTSVGATTLYWDANFGDPGSGDLGGNWETGWGGWNDAAGTGSDTLFSAGDSVVFSAGNDGITAKTITVFGSVATPSILLEEAGPVTLTAGTDGKIDITGGSTFDTSVLGAATGQSLAWNPVITGSGALTLKSHGSTADSGGASNSELTLSGANDFVGNISITSGLVSMASGFGAAGNSILLNGGGLVDENQNLTLARDLRIGASGGILRTGASSLTTISGSVSNNSGVATTMLRHTEGGTLRLSGSGAGFTGTVTNARGDLQLAAPSANWSTTAFAIDVNAGNLVFNGGGTATASTISVVNKNTLIENGTTLDVPTYTISPTAASGQAALIGANATVDGMITSSTGTLTLTNGQFASGTMGSNSNIVYATIVNPGVSTPLVFVKNNNNDLQLSRANTYSGGTTINAGRVNATVSGGFGTGKVTVKSGGQAYLSLLGGTYTNDFELTGNGVVDGATDKGALRLGSSTATGTVTIQSSGARIGATTSLLGKLAGPLAGSGALEINSSGSGLNGTISLTGSGSGYTGTLTVSQGRFNFSSALGGSVIVAPTATATTLGGGTSIAGNLTLNSTSKTVTFANTNGTLAIGGNLTLTGTNVVSLAKPAPGTTSVTLMTYGGSLTGTAANLSLENAASYRGTPAFDVSTAGQIRITGLNSQNLTWSGASGTWDIETAANWNSGGSTFSFGDAVTFTDAGTTKTVSMTANLEPASVTFNNSTGNDYTLGASPTTVGLVGTTGLVKSGTGTLTLGGTNGFTGPITVNAGRLRMNSQAAFGTSPGVTILTGGQVDINGQTPGNSNTGTNGYTYTIAGNGNDGAGAIVNTGANIDSKAAVKSLVLSNNASVGTSTRFDVGTDTKAGMGSINGAGFTLTKKGTGEVWFRGPATGFALSIEAGKAVAGDTDLAFGGASGSVSVSNGAQVATSGSRNIATPVSLSAGATVANAGLGTGIWSGLLTAAGDFTADTTGGDLVLRGGVSGSGLLTKSGSNNLILDAASNPFTGKMLIPSGELRAPSDAALGAAPVSLVPDAITLNGGTLRGGNASGTFTAATLGHPNRGITVSGGYTWTPGTGNSLTLDSPITVSNGMTSAAGTMIFNQPITGPGNLTVTGTATVNGGVNNSGSQEVITQNGGSLTFSGSGTSNITQLRVMTATLGISGSAVVNAGRFVICDASATTAVINQSGGTLNITGTDNTNTTSSSFLVGHWNGATTATYNLTGGVLNSTATLMSLGWDATTANFNQSGGTFNLYGINLANGRSNSAAFNLTGGRLNRGAGGITTYGSKSINLGGGTLGCFANWSTTQPITLTGTSGDVIVQTLDSVDGLTPRSITLGGTLSGTGGLTKSGAGTLSLDAAGSGCSGILSVNGGTLRFKDLPSASVHGLAGGTVAAGTSTTAGSSNVASLDLNASNASFRLAPTASDAIVVLDTDGFSVTNPSTLTGTFDLPLAVNSVFPVVDYDGVIGGLGFAGLSLQMANPHFEASLIDNTTNTTVDIKVTAVHPVLWKGNAGNVWDTNVTTNWEVEGLGTPTKCFDFDVVKFTSLGSAVPNVTLAGTIRPGQVEFNSATHYTLGGAPITGPGTLLQSGPGITTLANDNTFTGAATISAGTLEIGAGGTTGGITSPTVSNNSILVFNRGDAATFAGIISGSGQVVKRGAGNLTLSGVNTFSGATIVEAGTLLLGNGSATGTSAGGITVQSGATLDLNGVTLPIGETVTLAGAGPSGYSLTGTGTTQAALVLSANATIGGAARINLGTGAIPVTITGNKTLTKSGTNSVWYRGPENGTGNSLAAVLIQGGTFGVETGNNALGTVPVTVNPSGVFSAWGTSGGVAPTTQKNPVTLNGGALASGYDGQTWTGNIVLTANSILGSNDSAEDFTADGVISQSGGSYGLTKTTASIVTLSGVNTYTGNTTINTGTLILADNAGLKFVIGANGVNNKVTGAGTATLNGDFTLDLTGAATANGNTWTLVDATTKTFSPTFTVNGFTEAADVWTKTDGSTTWTFTEATGILSVSSTSGSYGSWETSNGITGAGAVVDSDNDGIPNGIEFVIGGDPSGPGSDSNALLPTTTLDGTYLNFVYRRTDASVTSNPFVQYGSALTGWTPAQHGVSGVVILTDDNFFGPNTDRVTVRIPRSLAVGAKLFARLRVDITP